LKKEMNHGEKELKRAMSNKKDCYSNGKEAQKVFVFQPYPFRLDKDIHERGLRQVLALGDQKVRLRCPISQREVEWDCFCYLVEERNDSWPHPD
jgi:hypothetical protein